MFNKKLRNKVESLEELVNMQTNNMDKAIEILEMQKQKIDVLEAVLRKNGLL